MRYKHTIGWLSIISWCLLSAVARVYTAHTTQTIDPTILCFYTFLFSTVVFAVCNAKQLKSLLYKLLQSEHRLNIFWLNFTTFAAWFFLIPPLKYIEPAIVSTITLGLGPIATLILGYSLYQQANTSVLGIIIALLTFVMVVYNIVLCTLGITTINIVSPLIIAYAISCCIIVGFGSAAGNIYSKKLSEAGFAPTEVLVSRFLMTVIVAGSILLIRDRILLIPISYYTDIIVVATCLVIIPLYLVQVSIKTLEPIMIATVAPLMPVLVYLLQIIGKSSTFTIWSLTATLPTSIFVLIGVYFYYQKTKKIYIKK
jgi:drug/metabolite transporter (DMT)-like permease